MGTSHEREDSFGNKYTEHRNADSEKTGETHDREDQFGNRYTEHRNPDWEKTGESREREDLFGGGYTEHRNADWKKTGESCEREDIFGNRYAEHSGHGSRATGTTHREIAASRTLCGSCNVASLESANSDTSLPDSGPTPGLVSSILSLALLFGPVIYFSFSSLEPNSVDKEGDNRIGREDNSRGRVQL